MKEFESAKDLTGAAPAAEMSKLEEAGRAWISSPVLEKALIPAARVANTFAPALIIGAAIGEIVAGHNNLTADARDKSDEHTLMQDEALIKNGELSLAGAVIGNALSGELHVPAALLTPIGYEIGHHASQAVEKAANAYRWLTTKDQSSKESTSRQLTSAEKTTASDLKPVDNSIWGKDLPAYTPTVPDWHSVRDSEAHEAVSQPPSHNPISQAWHHTKKTWNDVSDGKATIAEYSEVAAEAAAGVVIGAALLERGHDECVYIPFQPI